VPKYERPERKPGWLDARFLARLVETPRGRALTLGFLAEVETDEGHVFDTLLAKVDDPAIARLVRIHHDDEKRHNRILRECVERTGTDPGPLPESLQVTLRINRMLGGFSEQFVEGRRGVMEAYALLQVIEERAVRQYPWIVRALEAVDPESARVLASVVRDEERHVRYARAISRRFAPDPRSLATTLAHFRAIERRAFEEHVAATMSFTLDQGILAVHGPERLFWRVAAALNERRLFADTQRPFTTGAAAEVAT
jgi:rubrerythrin